ncbi:hypothetical protein Aglo01_29520 [Actinokineospora globicatena]|uniref:Uncharacterized protein n=1 Tax=Actinokineospora globicatena TaxID=103729 RepID=A0A9W6QLY5_9PSEU|nr:hypothetical protein Aglo01_29520 [Actinokineospora globicatena]GLW84866.1 hypothetical protein Aglo02_25060 [Actinokineospora globicatena]GLW91075.1 hypothetical protein Aglo03_18910 [Actinokineospora globicatena]
MLATCLTFELVTISSGPGNWLCADADGTPSKAEIVAAAAPTTAMVVARLPRREEGTLRTPLVKI